ncbi:LacI family DNA-binding transcriptional regulator [Paenibacillus thermotolerans]|uniref:LacI family DNA-binding transcriptional regulator n=1 Tax=Paenibacillus thermotolerans TaxID=3027807 RepID=UPI002367C7E5|nr:MULTISPECIES: LacI family DNA-binding transcriptional regulator [unclassified Paenibacillus]
MKITIKDVAKEAGVSIATVSRVLNGKDKIKSSTRQKVEKVIERLKFKPDVTARTMIMKQSQTVGLIVPQLTNEYYAQLAEAIEEELWEQGYTLVLCLTSSINENGEQKELASLASLVDRKVDGIIYSSSRSASEETLSYISGIVDQGIPVVAFDQQIAGISQVSGNHLKGAMDAVKHLIELGHTRIAYLGGPLVSPERELGYRNIHTLHGLPVDEALIRRGKPGFKFGFEAIESLIGAGERFTAVFCGNDLIAMGAIQALDHSGRKVPQNIAVVGYDDISMASLLKPRLTTMRQPIRRMGAAAVELLLENIAKKKAEHIPKQLVFSSELIVRETCGKRLHTETITSR